MKLKDNLLSYVCELFESDRSIEEVSLMTGLNKIDLAYFISEGKALLAGGKTKNMTQAQHLRVFESWRDGQAKARNGQG